MDGAILKGALWAQFGAAIDMLEGSVRACPEALWNDRSRQPQFWYLAYHTLFFLDFYLSESPESFSPPDPFTLSELDPAGVLPPRVYTRGELCDYAAHGRRKCREVLDSLSMEALGRPCGHERPVLSNLELHLYNLRHVQHGAAQLNLLIRYEGVVPPRWVLRTKE